MKRRESRAQAERPDKRTRPRAARSPGRVRCSPLQSLCAISSSVAANLAPGGLDIEFVGGRQHHGGFSESGSGPEACGAASARAFMRPAEHALPACAHWLARGMRGRTDREGRAESDLRPAGRWVLPTHPDLTLTGVLASTVCFPPAASTFPRTW